MNHRAFIRACRRPAAIIIAAVAIIAACAPPKSVAYYKAHPSALKAAVDQCVGRDPTIQECENARQAFYELNRVPARGGYLEAPQ